MMSERQCELTEYEDYIDCALDEADTCSKG